MQTRSILRYLIVCCVAAGSLFALVPAFATIMVWHEVPAFDNKLRILYASNHGYVEQYRQMLFFQWQKSFKAARNRLVAEGKIEDLPILITIPSPVFEIDPDVTEISLLNSCETPTGDSGQTPDQLGRCYLIEYVGNDNYKNFLTAIVATAYVEEEVPVLIENLESFESFIDVELPNFSSPINYYNPVWSPDSSFVVFNKSADGDQSFVLKTNDNKNIGEFKLDKGYSDGIVVWSADSRYFFVSSLRSVGLYDIANSVWTELELPATDPDGQHSNWELAMMYDAGTEKLMLSRDLGFFADYELLSLNPETHEFESLAKGLSAPYWYPFEGFRRVTLDDKKTSPNGRYLAYLSPVNPRDSGNNALIDKLFEYDGVTAQKTANDELKDSKWSLPLRYSSVHGEESGYFRRFGYILLFSIAGIVVLKYLGKQV